MYIAFVCLNSNFYLILQSARQNKEIDGISRLRLLIRGTQTHQYRLQLTQSKLYFLFHRSQIHFHPDIPPPSFRSQLIHKQSQKRMCGSLSLLTAPLLLAQGINQIMSLDKHATLKLEIQIRRNLYFSLILFCGFYCTLFLNFIRRYNILVAYCTDCLGCTVDSIDMVPALHGEICPVSSPILPSPHTTATLRPQS